MAVYIAENNPVSGGDARLGLTTGILSNKASPSPLKYPYKNATLRDGVAFVEILSTTLTPSPACCKAAGTKRSTYSADVFYH